tara:strand:+ start:141 stop:410 length:270 start_codon:yes stop_codon:yes gene_type:complete
MKIQKMISLDQETARLASQKSNFSNWVRDKLRSERNQREGGDFSQQKLNTYREINTLLDMRTGELFHLLESKSEAEIKVLIQILKNSVE